VQGGLRGFFWDLKWKILTTGRTAPKGRTCPMGWWFGGDGRGWKAKALKKGGLQRFEWTETLKSVSLGGEEGPRVNELGKNYKGRSWGSGKGRKDELSK